MGVIRSIIRWILTYILYPATVVGIFIYIGATIFNIIEEGKGSGRVRRVTAAALPLVILVFLIVSDDNPNDPLFGGFFQSLSSPWRFVTGAVVGVALMESGRWLLGRDGEIGVSLHTMFLSGLGAFLVWSIIGGQIVSLNSALLGLVVAGGLHVILRGPNDF